MCCVVDVRDAHHQGTRTWIKTKSTIRNFIYRGHFVSSLWTGLELHSSVPSTPVMCRACGTFLGSDTQPAHRAWELWLPGTCPTEGFGAGAKTQEHPPKKRGHRHFQSISPPCPTSPSSSRAVCSRAAAPCVGLFITLHLVGLQKQIAA